ncbi:MAG: DUF1289 domain-containing protein [Undibacterium sp.]|jgi:predicted Fe-S protein YdhL (DUF1289 family)|nr:DUF1289 domain-containing protein [Undibacterium sp.]
MTILYDYDPDQLTLANGGDVPSPCISICEMNASKEWCTGCFRSIEEITRWSSASNEAKRIIWRQIKHRMFDQS